MKRKQQSLWLLFAMAFVWVLFNNFSSNPPNGRTGAPGDGLCSDCHGGNNPNGFDGSVSITGLPATLAPNTTYPLTVTISNPNGAAARGGFQWVALNSANTNAGSMSNSGANATITNSSGRTYHEHAPAQFFAGNTSVSWTVDWTSPNAPANDETITLYAAGIVGNGSGSGGDLTVTSQVSRILPAGGGTPLTASIGNIIDVSCNGGSDGSATAIGFDGTPPYSYQWSNGETGEVAVNLPAGPASVTITDDANGSATANTTIGEPSAIQISITNQSTIDCNNPVATATASASGGAAGYSYQWSNGETGPTASNLGAGNNEVTVIDNNNCSATLNINITSDLETPVTNAGSDQTLTCSVTTVQLDGSVSNCANCTFTWTTADGNIVSGGNSLNPEVDAPGTYTLTATNPTNGCSSNDQVEVSQDISTPVTDAGPDQTLTCTVTTVQLDGSVSNCANCTFTWTTADGNIISGGNSLNPEVDAPGTYTLTATNPTNGCSSNDQVEVSQDISTPVTDAGPDQTLTCSVTTVQLDGSVSNCANCTFTWTTADGNIVSGGNSLNPEVDAPGTYTLTATNPTNGCSSNDQVEVSQDINAPNADAGPDQTLTCSITTVQLEGTAANCANCTFNWTTISGNIVSNPDIAIITVDAPGTYILSVTDPLNDCSSMDEVLVSEDVVLPVIDAGPDQLIDCNTSQVQLTASGCQNCTYGWTTANGNIVSDPNNASITVDAPGIYQVIATDPNNACIAMDEVEVSEDIATPMVDINGPNAICQGETATLSAQVTGGTAPYTYQWNTGESTSSITVQPSVTTEYALTVTGDNGCEEIVQYTLTVNENPTANAGADQSICDGESVNIVASANGGTPPYSYEWSDNFGTSSMLTITPTVSLTLSVTVTDANGCTDVDDINITVFNAPSITLDNQTNVSCFGDTDGSISVNVSGSMPFSFVWSNGSNTQNIDNLGAGNYSLTVTDANGCTDIFATSITEPSSLSLNTSSTGETAQAANDGTASVQVSGGTPPYTYLWSTGEETETIIGLTPGIYSVTVTDNNGCMATANVNISSFDCLITAIATTTDVTCNGGEDGTVSIQVSDAQLPLDIQWSNGLSGLVQTSLMAGTYSVSITDAANCPVIVNFTINEPDELIVLVDVQSESAFGANDGSATAIVSGGTAPYTYEWSTGANTESIDNLAPGNYEVSVIDNNGCVTIIAFTVNAFICGDITFDVEQTNNVCSGDANGSITVSNVQGVTGEPSYLWSNGAIGNSISDLPSGMYSLTITDETNCTATVSVEIIEEDTEAPTIIANMLTVSLDGNGQAVITAEDVDAGSMDNCGIATISISQENFDCSHIGENNIELTVTDLSGNQATATVNITVQDIIAPIITCPSDITSNSCGAINYELPIASDNCPTVSVDLIAGLPSGEIFPEGATTVTYSAIDESGNMTNCSFLVVVENTLNTNIVVTDVSCNGGSDGSIEVLITGGTPPYEIQGPSQDLSAGTYEIIITDATGCTIAETVTITEPALLTISANTQNISCFGEADGAIIVDISGGTPPYIITNETTNLPAGTYPITVEDANGCTATLEVTLTQPEEIIITVDEVMPQFIGDANMLGSISVTIEGGAGELLLEWIDEDGMVISNEEDIIDLVSGEYTLVVTDENGCVKQEVVFVDLSTNSIEIENLSNFQLFPNPTDGLLNVQFDLAETEEGQISVFSLVGELITQTRFEPTTTVNNRIDLSSQPQGVYLLQITINNQQITKRIIKQ